MNRRTPYYEADLLKFKCNAERIIEAFRSRYSNYNLAYSFKTNSFPSFLKVANVIGLFAEVASTREYLQAIETGFPKERIIWNGVIPDLTNKRSLISNGGIVNFDNLTELKDTIGCSCLPIGIRFNFYVGNGIESRFGIEVNTNDFDELIKYVERFDIHVKSVHCHISYARDLQSFRKRIEVMCEIAKLFNASIIDIGGNMYGDMDEAFKVQYCVPIPSIEDYATVICEVMNKEFPAQDVMLVTENGTPVASTAMDLVCKVIGKKKVGDTTVFTVDCKNSDVGFSCNNKNPTIYNMSGPSHHIEHGKIYGCTCLERDIIHRDFSGDIDLGSLLRIKNVGAYGYNVSSDFITDHPGVVLVNN